MRYEAKHNFFKKQLKSFKNVTKTLAKKHQSHVAYIWQTFDPNRLVIGPSKMVALNVMDRGCVIAYSSGTNTKVLDGPNTMEICIVQI